MGRENKDLIELTTANDEVKPIGRPVPITITRRDLVGKSLSMYSDVKPHLLKMVVESAPNEAFAFIQSMECNFTFESDNPVSASYAVQYYARR